MEARIIFLVNVVLPLFFNQRGLGSSQESTQTELITRSPPAGCRKETFSV